MRTVRTALLTRVHTPPGHLWFSVRKPIHFGQVAMVVAINWLSVMSVIDIRRSGLHTLATRDRSAAIPSLRRLPRRSRRRTTINAEIAEIAEHALRKTMRRGRPAEP